MRNITAMKIVMSPPIKDSNSSFDLDLRLKIKKIGKIGKIQGDNMDITPVVNEISGRISI